MKKIFLFLFFVLSVYGKVVTSEYKVTFGFFGEIGVANATLKTDGEKYVISVVAKSTGFAKTLSGNKQETYISEGIIENGVYKPLVYKSKVKSNSKEDFSSYIIDYENKKITRKRFIQKEDAEKIEKSEKVEDFFSENDVLSLFFNLPNYKDELEKKSAIKRVAIGANKDDRLVHIELLRDKELKEAKKLLGSGDKNTYLKVIINQDIFSSDKGELVISLDENNYCDKVMLQDVLFFGDIIGTEVRQEIID